MSERIRQGNRPPRAALADEIATAGGLIPEFAIDSYGGPISQVAQRFADTGYEHRGYSVAPRSMTHEFRDRSRVEEDAAFQFTGARPSLGVRWRHAAKDGVQSIGRECRTVFADNGSSLSFDFGVQRRRWMIPVPADAELETIDDALAMPPQERQMCGVEVERRDELLWPECERVITQVAARHVQHSVRDPAWHAVFQFGAPLDQQV